MSAAVCGYCGGRYEKAPQARRDFCSDPGCVERGVLDRVHALIVPEGEHQLWQGKVTWEHQVPHFELMVDRKRHHYRVVHLLIKERTGKAPGAKYVARTCDEGRCVALEHHMLTAKAPYALTIDAELPLEPLLSLLESRADLRGTHNSIIRHVKAKGFWTVSQVDAICCDHLNVHPTTIYGDLFWTAGTEEIAA